MHGVHNFWNFEFETILILDVFLLEISTLAHGVLHIMISYSI